MAAGILLQGAKAGAKAVMGKLGKSGAGAAASEGATTSRATKVLKGANAAVSSGRSSSGGSSSGGSSSGGSSRRSSAPAAKSAARPARTAGPAAERNREQPQDANAPVVHNTAPTTVTKTGQTGLNLAHSTQGEEIFQGTQGVDKVPFSLNEKTNTTFGQTTAWEGKSLSSYGKGTSTRLIDFDMGKGVPSYQQPGG